MNWKWRLAFGLGIASLVPAIAGGYRALAPLRWDAGRLKAREAADRLNRQFRRAGDALEELTDALSEAWDGPGTAPIHEGKALDEAWGRVAAKIAKAKPPAGTVIAFYDEVPDAASEDMRCAGYWSDGKVVREGLAGWAGLVPEAILHAESVRATSEQPTTGGLVWFTEDGPRRARLHRAFLYTRAVEDPRTKEGSTEDVFIEASAPFVPKDWDTVSVNCDVKDGRIAADLPPLALYERLWFDDILASASAISPEDVGWRFPADTSPTSRSRGEVWIAERARWPEGMLGFWSIAVMLALGATVFWWTLDRKSVAAAPDITAEAAHELKTPLTAMRGALEVALRRERTPAEYRETLAGTLEEVKGLQNLLTSVLLLTRGAASPRADEAVDLAAIVRAEVERAKGQATERRVTLRGGDDAATVTGDPSLLARAVGNLLDNAMLHSIAGGTIEVEIARGAGFLTVTVLDEGPGIPEARRERVFERFYRGPEVGQRGIPGAGLGLPISRWIAQSHGGSLTLDPSVTGRSRFVLRIPIQSS